MILEMRQSSSDIFKQELGFFFRYASFSYLVSQILKFWVTLPEIVSRILRPRPLHAITVSDPTNEHTVTYTNTLTLPYFGPKKQATTNETVKIVATKTMKPVEVPRTITKLVPKFQNPGYF